MHSQAIRKSFLDFFAEKEHTIVPSSSLLPDSPNLLFTNAGMNQFVPIFLGQAPCPYQPARAADTQKCIRAGGKHNDLDDVGLDTYHHTFFEMLGNWSFGDYFKQEAIQWAWELLVERWKFPAHRLFATVYKPEENDPATFDEEAHQIWESIFKSAGLDPQIHIVHGNKKDNFWMMGETGPCGPCSEIHINLQPDKDYVPSKGRLLVNAGSALCIEIWNLVFIQFNATPDGSFIPLPARHVDTGMGFERVCSIIQGTQGFTHFENLKISNYATDIFEEILEALAHQVQQDPSSHLPILDTLLQSKRILDFESALTKPQTIAFRVIADHLRTLSFAIADGIMPSNEGRGYVLRRILRRAVKFGRVELGIQRPFLSALVPALVRKFSSQFPELAEQEATIISVIRAEEDSFGRTVERGLALFHEEETRLKQNGSTHIAGDFIFKLYDTYGFPFDLTELLAREAGLTLDRQGFDRAMEEQRQRSQAAQKRTVIEVNQHHTQSFSTQFIGYDHWQGEGKVLDISIQPPYIVLSETPCYAEMGGQLGDQGTLYFEEETYRILDTQKTKEGIVIHLLDRPFQAPIGTLVCLQIDRARRHRIASHHTATHLLHWALRRVLGTRVAQRGSYVGPDRLRFDFSHGMAMTSEEIYEVERLVRDKIAANDAIHTQNRLYHEVKNDSTILQFFGEKYGNEVRVVDIGGYSKELCGGTHLSTTSEVGFFKILSESAIAAGVRRIEAACGQAIIDYVQSEWPRFTSEIQAIAQKYQITHPEPLPTRPESGSAPDKAWEQFEKIRSQLDWMKEKGRERSKEEAKAREAILQKQASEIYINLSANPQKLSDGTLVIVADLSHVDHPTATLLPLVADHFKQKNWEGIIILGISETQKASLLVSVSKNLTSRFAAGKIIQQIAPIIGGKGGGRADLAQGGGPRAEALKEALSQAFKLLN